VVRTYDLMTPTDKVVGVSPNRQSILIGFDFVSLSLIYIYEYMIRYFFIGFVLFQNNEVPGIISLFNGTLNLT